MKHIATLRVITAIACVFFAQKVSALQGGNIMPDYATFVPADNPDVVNLNTGDFNYSLPLGEIPGPYGSYPMSMGYQAGIGPNQEATWVGLGWTLNPGAINRTLRGAPDDQFHGGELAYIYQYSKSSAWGASVGYGSSCFSVNLSYSSTGGMGISATYGPSVGFASIGLTFGTNGIGLGVSANVGGVGINGSVSMSWDGETQDASIGLSGPMGGNSGGATLDASIGLHHQNGHKIAVSANFGAATESGTGVSLSTDGQISANYGVGKYKDAKGGTHNSVGSISFSVPGTGIGISSSNGASQSSVGSVMFGLIIPLPIPQYPSWISFGYNRSIYESWVRQATNEYLYGYMYQAGPAVVANGKTNDVIPVTYSGSAATTGPIPWNWNYKGKTLDRVGNPMNGDLEPAWDLYSVTAEGISGSFHPYGLTRHSIVESIEKLDPKDQSPQALHYLLDEDLPNNTQAKAEFPVAKDDGSNLVFTNNAYDYCFDAATSTGTYQGASSSAQHVADLIAGKCSKFALLKSNHLNESNRLIIRRSSDDSSRFRSRMVFRFMADGFFAADDAPSASKLGQFDLDQHFMKKTVNGVQYGVWGSRRVEPILEGDDNTGKLQGFKITNPDGKQYFFTQPVKTLLQADYTTNQKTGAPLFVDQHDSHAGDNVLDLLSNAFGYFAKYGIAAETLPFSVFLSLVSYDVTQLSFKATKWIWEGSKYKDNCSANKPDDALSYSYNMKVDPFATQWLLKEIRGPEFVQLDPKDMTKNIGYQVRFNYREPAWYKWRFPYAPPNTPQTKIPNFRLPKNGETNTDCTPDLYQASFGVKELVYLSSIETATHKADFFLNDSVAKPRLDAKGWVQDWSAHAEVNKATPSSTAMPLFVNTQIEATVNPVSGSAWKKYCREDEDYLSKDHKRSCWWEKPVVYHIPGIYININPTQTQISRLKKKLPIIVVTGMDRVSQEHLEPTSKYLDDDHIDPNFIPVKLVFHHLDKSLLRMGTAAPVFDTLLPVSGEKSKLGTYFLRFKTEVTLTGTVPAYDGHNISQTTYDNSVYRQNYGFNTCTKNDNFGTITWTCQDPAAAATAPANDNAIPKSVIMGAGISDFKWPAEMQPMMVMNDFYETDSLRDNQMRYLDSIKVGEKIPQADPLAPLMNYTRKYVFGYDYNIQPGTLNSYPSTVDPVTKKSDLTTGYPDVTDASLNGLGGKLRLNSLQEFACGNANCSQSISLPPFRFNYKESGASSFYKGEEFYGSIINSSDPQDEWGFWNKYATHDNHKVNQNFADYGAAAWSLDRVIDPLGGVMEIQYERDTYQGESYEDDTKAIPIGWRRCISTLDPATSQDENYMCIDVLPRRWTNYCDLNNKMRGEYKYNSLPAEQITAADYAYAGDMTPGKDLYFELDGNYDFEVGCGPDLLRWAHDGCPREREIGVLGSGRIQGSPGNAIVTLSGISVPNLDNNANEFKPANQLKSLQTNIPYTMVLDKIKHVGKDFTRRNEVGDAEPVKGIMWIRDKGRHLKGGDIRVKKLVKRDIGSSQTTVYKYSEGEMAQYPDSVLSTAFAERFSPSKVIGVLPNTVLPSISRIPGVSDENADYLPGAKITYPKVTVYNTNERIDQVLNGKMVYDFITPQTGYDLSSNGYTGMFRLKLDEIIYNGQGFTAPAVPNIDISLLDGSGAVITKLTQVPHTPVRRMDESDYHYCMSFKGVRGILASCREQGTVHMEAGKMTVFQTTYYSNRPIADLSGMKAIKVDYTGTGTSGAITTLTVDLNQVAPEALPIKRFLDLSLSLGINEYHSPNNVISIGNIKQSDNVPIVFNATTPDQPEQKYADFTSFLEKPTKTTTYRWMPASSSDVNPFKLDDPANLPQDAAANLAKYKIMKQDSFVYSSRAPSADDRFITDVRPESLGVDEDLWQYKRKYNCADANTQDLNCDLTKGGFKPYKYADFTTNAVGEFEYRKRRYTRYSAFTKEMYSKTGFENSANSNDYIVTKLANNRFDPITGIPSFAVTYSGPASPANPAPWYRGPAKATRTWPAYTSNTPLGNTMFERNMLTQTYREDAFTWQKAVTTNDDTSGAELNFASADIDDPAKMGPALTAVQVTPYTQRLLTRTGSSNGFRALKDRDNPILGLGAFKPRFNPAEPVNYSKMGPGLMTVDLSNNPAITAFAKDWSGTVINFVNNQFKATDESDVYGIHSSHRYDPTGFHQIAAFNNAPVSKTLAWTSEGRTSFPDVVAVDTWRYTSGAPVLDGIFLKLTGNFTLSHPLQWYQGEPYVVEMQVHSPGARSCQVSTSVEGGATGEVQNLNLKAGLNTYQVFLNATLAPSPGDLNNRFKFSCQDNSTAAVKLAYLRAYPQNAEAGLYIFDARKNMIQSVNEQNVSTYYSYDWFGNVTGIRNADGLMFSAHKREWTNVGQ